MTPTVTRGPRMDDDARLSLLDKAMITLLSLALVLLLSTVLGLVALLIVLYA